MKGTRLFAIAFILFAAFWGAAKAQDSKTQPDPKKDQEPKKTDTKMDQETPEEKMRRTIQEEWQRRVARLEKLINIDVKDGKINLKDKEGKPYQKDAKISDILDVFREQGGVNIDLDPRNIPEDFKVLEFKMTNEPFQSAFDAFLLKADLAVIEESATLIRLARPARVSFNFRDTDVRVVIDMIARISGANIIVGPAVKGLISVSVNNVPWNEVLTDIAKTLKFTTVREKFDIIRVIHPDELLTQMDVRVYRLKYIQPPALYRAKVQEGNFISGKPPQTQQANLEQLLKDFVLKKVLENALTRDGSGHMLGNLDFDVITNSFLVRDTKPVLDKIDEILKLIDVEPPQVLIDVKFVSTSNQDLLSFGMNFALGTQEGLTVQTRPLARSLIFNPTPTATVPAIQGTPFTETSTGASSILTGQLSRLPFGGGRSVVGGDDQFFLTEYEMIATMRAFKRDRYSKLVQEPTLAVLDNTEATIFVGEQISYAEVSTQLTQFGTPVNTIQEAGKSPIKVGFQLYVIPKIIVDQNKVILTVIPTNDVLSGISATASIPGFNRFTLQLAGANAFIDLPQISSTTVVTKLIIESGRTAVLGGLVAERINYEDKGIPILKDIPIISYLFKQRNDTTTRSHLLIFITPRIVPGGRRASDLLNEATKRRDTDMQREMDQLKQKTSKEELLKQEEERRKRELDELEKIRRGEK